MHVYRPVCLRPGKNVVDSGGKNLVSKIGGGY